MTTLTPATKHTDEINIRILEISEDRISGFVRNPMAEIARRTGLDTATVIERIRLMLEAGTIRRVRQTLMATDLAPGALIAWNVPGDKLDTAFETMFKTDPFSGHIVVRSTDSDTAGSQYRLWTTLKVPAPYSMEKHCNFLMQQTGATRYILMPAKGIFALGVGHTRRKSLEPGARAEELGEMHKVEVVQLTELDWQVLIALKREFAPAELSENLWEARAREAGVSLEKFYEVAESLDQRRVIGRFSTFLEHVKPTAYGERVTKFNGLFHWAVPPDRVIEAGRQVARHHIMTHCYWREGGPEFGNVNIMGVAHGSEKDRVLAHKAAIDQHLREAGIDFTYTNVFWGGRSEIKPSEISPQAYREWCVKIGLDPASMI